MILALDTATTSGACWGAVGDAPQYESWVAKGDSLGEKKSRFRFWLMAKVMAFQPDLICFEAPYIPVQRAPQLVRAGTDPSRAPKGPPPMNPSTLRLLLAFSGTVEEIAFERHIRCRECVSGEFVKFWTGKGAWGGRGAKKEAVMRVCRQRGFDPPDDNAADAISLWHYAEHVLSPDVASRRAAGANLDLPLYGTLSAPTRPVIGRRVLS